MRKDDNQHENELNRIEKWEMILESLVIHFASSHSGTLTREHIFDVLFILMGDKHKIEWAGDLYDIEIELKEAIELLSNFDFNVLYSTIETEEGFIPDEFLIQYKVRIKNKGLTWIIHKYDADPFPSNPHAHQLNNNIKLDLSNGNCYKIREYIHTVHKKDLLLIRELFAQKYKGNLPPIAIN